MLYNLNKKSIIEAIITSLQNNLKLNYGFMDWGFELRK